MPVLMQKLEEHLKNDNRLTLSNAVSILTQLRERACDPLLAQSS
jgi:hypothetical protein